MVKRIRLNFTSCVPCLSGFQKKATAFQNPHTWSFTASPQFQHFFVQWTPKSRKSSLYNLILLVMCIFLDTSVFGSALHPITSNIDWEVLTAVLLTFKAFWDTRPFDWLLLTDCQKNCTVTETSESTHKNYSRTSQNNWIIKTDVFKFNGYLPNVCCQEMFRKVLCTGRTHTEVAVLILGVYFPIALLLRNKVS
jgi:hypothetical protein